MHQKTWDIFCKVVDNFGDIGVCWRLARQLSAEHGLDVRLWVDDLMSFRRLCPEINPRLQSQRQRDVLVEHWTSPFPETAVADVVIEAFACQLPESYLAAMAKRQPVWINLEYLSAEAWVADCHRLPSPHPHLPLSKHFFFPGFTAGTGGLLREAGLLEERDCWRKEGEQVWARFGLPPPQPRETSVSLFCYENPALPELLGAWAEGAAPVRCLVPEGRTLVEAGASLGFPDMTAGDRIARGRLTLHALPFVAPEQYDHLLWSCDLNLVRGEDSFVRAQWAARPLVWQPYPQREAAHLIKLDAFLDLYCNALSPSAAKAWRGFSQAWNLGSGVADAWPALWQERVELAAHASSWAEKLAKREDLASALVKFSEKLL